MGTAESVFVSWLFPVFFQGCFMRKGMKSRRTKRQLETWRLFNYLLFKSPFQTYPRSQKPYHRFLHEFTNPTNSKPTIDFIPPPLTNISSWIYENRVSKHFVISLNFPCLTCLLCCLLKWFFFVVVFHLPFCYFELSWPRWNIPRRFSPCLLKFPPLK